MSVSALHKRQPSGAQIRNKKLWSHDSVAGGEGTVISDRPDRQEPQFAISFQPPVPAARKEGVVERADSLEQSQGE